MPQIAGNKPLICWCAGIPSINAVAGDGRPYLDDIPNVDLKTGHDAAANAVFNPHPNDIINVGIIVGGANVLSLDISGFYPVHWLWYFNECGSAKLLDACCGIIGSVISVAAHCWDGAWSPKICPDCWV